MNLRAIPRAAVGTSLKLARLPLDVAFKLTGAGPRGEAVLDRADAAARDVAGAALGDDELRHDAGLRRASADERERAQDLRETAEQRAADAAAAAQESKNAAAERRREGSKRAAERRRSAEQAATKRREQATSAAERRKAASDKAVAKTESALDTRAKRERLSELEREQAALEQRKDALTAADEAARLRDAAGRAKAARKS